MKKLIVISFLTISLFMCGCLYNNAENSAQDKTVGSVNTDSQIKSDADGNGSDESEKTFVQRVEVDKVSAPNGSITFEEACEILDSCDMYSLYLPQSAKDYKKSCCGIIKLHGSDYYSVYMYIEDNGKKIYVGTNYLVSCDGEDVRKKTWTGDYAVVEMTYSESDETVEKLYAGAKITPNEALKILCGKGEKALGLENDISKYTFEADSEFTSVYNFECYKIIPKIEYSMSTDMLSPYYVNVDGSGEVYKEKTGEPDEYEELK